MTPLSDICPCSNQQRYAECCGPFHKGALPPHAEKLMRSRYSAYVLHLQNYLLATWHVSTRPQTIEFEPHLYWLGLDIQHADLSKKNSATVEFIARYKINQQSSQLHEISHFIYEEGRWYYVDGIFPDNAKNNQLH